jgi:nucleotide-binding universal stress UspA family protein
MADIKTVVYPTDFSDVSLRSLPWAKRLAAVLDAELHCVHTVEEPVAYSSLELGAIPLPTVEELKEGAQKRLSRFMQEHLADSNASSDVLVGRPANQIVDYANEKGAAMIVMSTHGYSGIKHVVMGSTTEAVLRQAECPVLAVPVS